MDFVSVKKLCERAGIYRSTFYAHYGIPGDVYHEMEEEILKETLTYLSGMTEKNETEKIELFLRYIKENRDVMKVFFVPAQNTLFLDKLIQYANLGLLFTALDSQAKVGDYIRTFSLEGSKGILTEWVISNCRESEKDVAKLLITLNQYAIYGVQREILKN